MGGSRDGQNILPRALCIKVFKQSLVLDQYQFCISNGLAITHGRKIQGVEAPKVLTYPPTDNAICSNLLFQVVLSIYGKYK